ncbi:unnamed protein product [Heterotrigona itama]|uniref:Bromo domain-containing protein n=1 Tax=Heterotrigona itama TaxID=395501 RepID=A0A6V7GU54_9HYME|nr:unnamed protein product [Heterotrigona itama]
MIKHLLEKPMQGVDRNIPVLDRVKAEKRGIQLGDADESLTEISKRIPNQQLLPPSTGEHRICITSCHKNSRAYTSSTVIDSFSTTMEKRDPKQFLAWKGTESIAPELSQIITNSKDFSTLKQKIDDNSYQNLNKFVENFKLMCDTPSPKKLPVGLKMVAPGVLRQIRPVLTYMQDISKDELGFKLGKEYFNNPDVSKIGANRLGRA